MALKKAQMASAKKRRGTGKAKPVGNRRRRAAPAPVARRRRVAAKAAPGRKRRIAKRAGAGAAIAAAAVGGAYVYKNRERLIVAKQAERFAIKGARKAKGSKLTKTEKHRVRMEERRNHASRSTYRVREYHVARDMYKAASAKGLNIRPLAHKNNAKSLNHKANFGNLQNYLYDTYAKDRNARAVHRLNRIKGKKTTGFSYSSGKTKKVIWGRTYRMPF